MPIFDLFSKRQKVLRGEVPDVYQYDTFPESFRVQIIHILRDALGNPQAYDSRTDEVYKSIHNALAREYGLFVLSIETTRSGAQSGLYDFLLKAKSAETVVDVIELSFSVIDSYCREWEFSGNSEPKITPDDAIAELNTRLREHGIGYQFESSQMVRIDSTVIHADVVRPALQLLADKSYAGANAEFLAAHSHYRHGRYKESLNEALKALESTLKTICSIRRWPHDATDIAKSSLIFVLRRVCCHRSFRRNSPLFGHCWRVECPRFGTRHLGMGRAHSRSHCRSTLQHMAYISRRVRYFS